MKRTTLAMLVDALDGPHRELVVAVLREELGTTAVASATFPTSELRARPKSAAERQAAYKARHRSRSRVTAGDAPGDESHVTGDVTSRSLSLSSSSESAEKAERESPSLSGNAREPVTGVTSSVTRLVTSPPSPSPGERYVTLTDAPDDELLAIASMAGVQDVEGAWLKFCGHFADKWVHVAGRWQGWCVREAKTERRGSATRRSSGARTARPP